MDAERTADSKKLSELVAGYRYSVNQASLNHVRQTSRIVSKFRAEVSEMTDIAATRMITHSPFNDPESIESRAITAIIKQGTDTEIAFLDTNSLDLPFERDNTKRIATDHLGRLVFPGIAHEQALQDLISSLRSSEIIRVHGMAVELTKLGMAIGTLREKSALLRDGAVISSEIKMPKHTTTE